MILAVAAAVAGCSKKDDDTVDNRASRRRLEAWMEVNFPNATMTGLGAYVVGSAEGSGKSAGMPEDNQFARLDYIAMDLSGVIQSFTGEDLAKQLYTYDKCNYYGPQIINRFSTANNAAIEEALEGMKEGGSCSLVVPGWLNTYVRYDTADEYFNKVSGSHMIYSFHLMEAISDIEKWECDSIERYLAAEKLEDYTVDTVGFYLIRRDSPSSDQEYTSEDTFNINYTARRLDGQIIDTSIRDVAEAAGLPLNSGFGTKKITMADSESEIKMDGAGVISGFSKALKKLHPGEEITVVFSSSFGYSTSGSGSRIPGYCPLRFDIEVVE